MGGIVKIILRVDEKTTHVMNRWTNTFPKFINSSGFIEKDMNHLNSYMKEYLDMKDDYERNHESNEFEFDATTAYFPEDGIKAPRGYGLIVIDYVNSKVLSCQDYSTPGQELLLTLGYHLSDGEIEDKVKSGFTTPELIENFQKLLNDNRLNTICYWNGSETECTEVTKEEILSISNMEYEQVRTDYGSGFINIDLSPWEVINYVGSEDGYNEFRKDFQALGFELTEEEHIYWDAFIKNEFE